MMKKLPFVFAIPAIAVIIVVVVAMAIKIGKKPETATVAPGGQLPSAFSQTQKSAGAGGGFGEQIKTIGTADLSHDLSTTVDDGGEADIKALNSDAIGL